MPWVNDLAAGFGLPSGAATIAVALYGACKAAQGAARREAIDEIGHFLDDPKWTRSIRPSQIAERIFIATFGEQHTSIQCIKRSILASLIFIGAIILVLRVDGFETRYIFAWSFWIYLPFVGIFADYMALLKTRILLRASITPVILVILDVTASVGISTVVYFVVKIFSYIILKYWELKTFHLPYDRVVYLSVDAIEMMWMSFIHRDFNQFFPPVMFMSTLLTSIWTLAIVISSVALKLLVPLQRGTAWFFDVEKRPIEAIGIVAGVLIFACSIIWSLARWIS